MGVENTPFISNETKKKRQNKSSRLIEFPLHATGIRFQSDVTLTGEEEVKFALPVPIGSSSGLPKVDLVLNLFIFLSSSRQESEGPRSDMLRHSLDSIRTQSLLYISHYSRCILTRLFPALLSKCPPLSVCFLSKAVLQFAASYKCCF